jgi:hypothetical protein
MKNKKLNKYEIQSGDINGIFEGKTHETAFKKAIERFYHNKKKYPMLGRLIRFREIEVAGQPIKKSKKNDLGEWKYQDPLAILNSKRKMKNKKVIRT